MICLSRILIADGEYRTREIVKKYALGEGYDVSEATGGLQAISLCRLENFDLIIMDIEMPDIDGFSVCEEIRKRSDVPIIILSARGEEDDKIHGFEHDIDDYVVKPFFPKELMMRVNAVLRRTTGERSPKREAFVYKGLQVDFRARKALLDGKNVDMTPKESDLLFYFVKNSGIALTREKILNKIWGNNYFDRTLDTHIRLLRKSLGEYGKCIVTLRGVGYRFDAEDALS